MASWWNTLKRVLRSEASDAKEEFDKLRQSIDRELTRKERELEATPAERVEMILEEIEAGEGRLDEIAQELEGRLPGDRASDEGAPDDGAPDDGAPDDGAPDDGAPVDTTPGAKASSDAGDPPARRTVPRARLLVPADVSSSPLLGHALTMVTVDDPAPNHDFEHQVRISPEAEPLIGPEHLAGLPAEVGEHALVLDVSSDTHSVFFVKAPGLHHEDVQLIAAAAVAAHLPNERKEQPGGEGPLPSSDAR